MPDARIALATCDRIPTLPPDEQLLIHSLAASQIRAEAVVWSDPEVRWTDFAAIVIRSCWDYYHRPNDFLDWVDRVAAAGLPIWNPPPLLRWNAEKTYLRGLESRGVAVVPTRWVPAPGGVTLAALMASEGWARAIVKPTVSATAHQTWRVERADAAAHEERFRRLCARGGVMVQPYLESIETDGEWSLCWFAGQFSHGVLKRPASGDFRVQVEFGGTSAALPPPAAALAAARRTLDEVDGPWLYARVDGCMVAGAFQLIELEMLEPSFFLDADPGAAGRFARAIVETLSSRVEPHDPG